MSNEQPSDYECLYRLPKVLTITGLSRSTWYAYMERGIAPRPVQVGLRAVAWRRSDIERWVKDCSENAPAPKGRPEWLLPRA